MTINTEPMSPKILPKPVKFVIQLPPWYDRKLRLWARVKGTQRATLAANIIQARIEANWPDVERELDRIAESLGVTREHLEIDWVNEEDESQC